MVLTGTTVIGAGETSPNVLKGSAFEDLIQDSLVQMAAIVQTVGKKTIQCTFNIGGVSMMVPPYALIFPTAAGQATIPNNLYHNYVYIGGNAGDALYMTFANSDSAAVTVDWLVRIDPV